MTETEKPTMSRYNQILLTIMNELDRAIEKYPFCHVTN